MSYYSRKLVLPFQVVVERVIASLQEQGFGIITTIDVRDTFREKLNVGFRNYKILGACNPDYAYKALSLESHMGGNLPCNVVVQEHENGEVEISATNPAELLDEEMQITNLKALAVEIGKRLRQAVDNLEHHTSEAPASALPSHDDEFFLWPIQG